MDNKHENVLNVSNHQGKANQNYNEIPILTMAGSHEGNRDFQKEGREK